MTTGATPAQDAQVIARKKHRPVIASSTPAGGRPLWMKPAGDGDG
jgi:hypothetical protein